MLPQARIFLSAMILGSLLLSSNSMAQQPVAPASSAPPPSPADAMAAYLAKLKKDDPEFAQEIVRHQEMHYPVERPQRTPPLLATSRFSIHPDQEKQNIRGIGFEIMSDSIASGNRGLLEEHTSVPHDLVPEERRRFVAEMLKGFRYCRLAGGLYLRGLDAEEKHLAGRWPEQLPELHDMIAAAGVEGFALEYWSPPPFWKANRKYVGGRGESENILRCFGKDFINDPEYHGDVDRFLNDFAAACVQDIKTLRAAGLPVLIWGLQNEPPVNSGYSSCRYTTEQYVKTFKAVAQAIRAYDPKIWIIADTGMSNWDYRFIRPVLNDPKYSGLVDALPVHLIGADSKFIRPPSEPSGKPRFTNEYEYITGPASAARCVNTVQVVMNWFQLADAPTWFWIHALKPYKNSEASGYSLGFWRPVLDSDDSQYPADLKPGHWIWNKYNWYAVASFLRHMPWDCRSVRLTEDDGSDDDLRIMAFKRPNGKLTVMLSNRSTQAHTFQVNTGLDGRTFQGWRYTPESAGPDFSGVSIGTLHGGVITPNLPDMSWEFWEEQ